jgi:phosphoribosylformylglycinamidine (FGAM) synthase PurS component
LKPHLKKLLQKSVKEIRRDKVIERILTKESPSKKTKNELDKYEKWRK